MQRLDFQSSWIAPRPASRRSSCEEANRRRRSFRWSSTATSGRLADRWFRFFLKKHRGWTSIFHAATKRMSPGCASTMGIENSAISSGYDGAVRKQQRGSERRFPRKRLEVWLETLVADFEDRTLPFDVRAARFWGRAVGQARKEGRSLSVVDSQIASIAGVHNLAVVTRNVGHFGVKPFDAIKIINPWD